MIKKETVYRLQDDKIVPLLDAILSLLKFKYSKGAKTFSRTVNGFKQNIRLHSSSAPIEFDEATDELRLTTYVEFFIEIPAFEAWHIQHLGLGAGLRQFVCQSTCFLLLEFDDFSKEDFYTPSKAAIFKSAVLSSLGMDSKQEEKAIEIQAYITDQLSKDLQNLEQFCNIETIFDNRDFPLSSKHINLLVYGGFKEKAGEFYDRLYQYHLDQFKEIAEGDTFTLNSRLGYFQTFLKNALNLLGKQYHNPYNMGIVREENKQEQVKLTDGYTFKEVLRLKSPSVRIFEYSVNSRNGEILIYQDNNTIVKYSSDGQELLNFVPDRAPQFYSYDRNIGCIEETGTFFIGNIVILADNRVIYLPVFPLKDKKAKKGNAAELRSFDYSPKTGNYYALFMPGRKKSLLHVYNREFELVKSTELEGMPKGIIPVKEWIITYLSDNKNLFWDTDGNKLFELEYASGNNYFDISVNARYFMSFFYSTKSQFYDLETLEQKPLWAHPTYIKNYKEKLYNPADTRQGYGMSTAKFSTDESYIAGCADHGKYVAWKLPGLERVELIPEKDVFPYLIEPEIVELDGQTFLKNRGYGIRHINFFNNSDYFLMQMEDSVMIWNRGFKNIGFLPDIGRIHVYGDNFLLKFRDNELVLYRRN